LHQLLWPHLDVVRSPKSYNSQVGVPLSVLNTSLGHDLSLFEAGISTVGEMQHLTDILSPNYGVFTGIGSAHAAGFESETQKIKEKLLLFKGVEVLFLCLDNDEVISQIPKTQTLFGYSINGKLAALNVKDIQKEGKGALILYSYQKNDLGVWIPFTDAASIENALLCLSILHYLNIPQADIVSGFSGLNAVEMRLEVKKAKAGGVLINDVYNSDIDSIKIALSFMQRVSEGRKKRLILSDVKGSSEPSVSLYEKVAFLIHAAAIDELHLVGKEILKHGDLFKVNKVHLHNTTDELLDYLKQSTQASFCTLVKGAREFRFEKIIHQLEERTQEATLEINLKCIEHNLSVYRSKLPANVKCMTMLKAYAYGTGAFEVAKTLEYNRVEYIGVAYPDEGIELRKKGIETPVMIMNVGSAHFDLFKKWNLEPVIQSLSMLEKCLNWSEVNNNKLGVHLEFDTGMHRLGFDYKELDQVLNKLNCSDGIKVSSIFSHLVASSLPEHDGFTRTQITIFDQINIHAKKLLSYEFDSHILNSGGIERFGKDHYSMVRLGVGLYGIGGEEISSYLQPVLKLVARISKISIVEKGASVGYKRSFIATEETKVATVSIGYADGLSRLLGNGNGVLYVNGHKAPIIGEVCMDMCMVDVSHAHNPKEGDQVVVFETIEQLKELSENAQTISYETLTSISGRVRRVYHH